MAIPKRELKAMRDTACSQSLLLIDECFRLRKIIQAMASAENPAAIVITPTRVAHLTADTCEERKVNGDMCRRPLDDHGNCWWAGDHGG